MSSELNNIKLKIAASDADLQRATQAADEDMVLALNRTRKAVRVTDLDYFESVLPENWKIDGHVDRKIRETLLRHFTGQLANVSTPQDAIAVLEMAANRIHSATQREFQNTAGLLLDENLEVGCNSTRSKIVRAFDAKTLAPCIIKFGRAGDVAREAQLYQRLRDSNLNFVPNEIVTVEHHHPRAGESIDKSVGLKMPIYVSSLAVLPKRVPENVVHIRAASDILPALDYMHAQEIFHMDVKLENILLDTQGRWFLADFGSCASEAEGGYGITAGNKPRDLPSTPPSARYDRILLAVACMDLTVGFLAAHRAFSLVDLRRAAETDLGDEEFKAFVRSLIV
jgi:hypothetical protein